MKLEPYKDYATLHQIIDTLDARYTHDLSVSEAVKICLQHFPQWAIVEMVTTAYPGTDWAESKLFSNLLKTEAHKVYPSNLAFT